MRDSKVVARSNKRLSRGSSTIYAVDFDGTLCTDNFPFTGEPNERLINFLKSEKRRGCRLILWTCRYGPALDAAVMWGHDQGLEFDAVNRNLPEIAEKFGSDSRKVHADVYIDDKIMEVIW